jgi:hypothetical protein
MLSSLIPVAKKRWQESIRGNWSSAEVLHSQFSATLRISAVRNPVSGLYEADPGALQPLSARGKMQTCPIAWHPALALKARLGAPQTQCQTAPPAPRSRPCSTRQSSASQSEQGRFLGPRPRVCSPDRGDPGVVERSGLIGRHCASRYRGGWCGRRSPGRAVDHHAG